MALAALRLMPVSLVPCGISKMELRWRTLRSLELELHAVCPSPTKCSLSHHPSVRRVMMILLSLFVCFCRRMDRPFPRAHWSPSCVVLSHRVFGCVFFLCVCRRGVLFLMGSCVLSAQRVPPLRGHVFALQHAAAPDADHAEQGKTSECGTAAGSLEGVPFFSFIDLKNRREEKQSLAVFLF